MKEVPFKELKKNCHRLISEVQATGEGFLITMDGKAISMIGPYVPEPPKKFVFGKFRDTVKVVGDIVSPLDEPWDLES